MLNRRAALFASRRGPAWQNWLVAVIKILAAVFASSEKVRNCRWLATSEVGISAA
jgi:hypothetical protein